MTDEDLKAEIDRLKTENERLRRQPDRVLSMKVSQKGALSAACVRAWPISGNTLQGAMDTTSRRRR